MPRKGVPTRCPKEVEQYPVLYKTTMKAYKKGDVQAKARVSIAKQFEGCSPLDVKDRWTYLKDQFKKACKVANQDDPSGTGTDDNSDDIDEGLQNIIDNTSFDLHSDLITIYEDDGNTSNSSKDLETSRSNQLQAKERHAMNDNIESEFGFILSSLKEIAKSKPEVSRSMPISSPIINQIQHDWTCFCQNFAIRVADLPDEDSRDAIRMGMENLYWQN
ncbi:Uncharacterized protein APZ42_023185 [Daphnia magna]|uniref:MADF domain-containing protein n=1 Tax=Daphnia magna TaxID=35525 RepID=A0A164V649_9CRUS|nr:Uncharacterized protein APZ42_023185 [Daphnia magna]